MSSYSSSCSHSFLLLLFFFLLSVWESHQYCAPDCAGADPGTYVRDPTDCTRYYVCLDINGEMLPSEEPLDCPDQQYFSEEHTVPRCDDIADAPSGFCAPLCNPCVPDCRLDNPGTVQPHPESCSNYYVCLADGLTLEETCPTDSPYFDFRTGLCQDDATLCYHYCDPCLPHCTTQGQTVPDPTDCTQFVYCTPPTSATFVCPHDEVFNPDTLQCEEGAVCQEPCYNYISTTASTTETPTFSTTEETPTSTSTDETLTYSLSYDYIT